MSMDLCGVVILPTYTSVGGQILCQECGSSENIKDWEFKI